MDFLNFKQSLKKRKRAASTVVDICGQECQNNT